MTRSAPRRPDPFSALGDPNRRAIVERLGRGGQSVQDLADALPISRPAVSRHLRLLKDAGLVTDSAVGTRHIYSLESSGVTTARDYLAKVWGERLVRFRIAAEANGRRSARR